MSLITNQTNRTTTYEVPNMNVTRTYTVLNRNEFAMSREDDFAQTAAVRSFVEGKILSETELFRLGISPDEPFRTMSFTDDPEELAALASQSTRSSYWIAYADGRIIAKEPATHGAWGRVRDALNGYVATQRILHDREPEAPTMDKISARHLEDLPNVPFPAEGTTVGFIADDKLPLQVRWFEGEQVEDDDEHMPYVEGVSEAAAMGYRSFRPAPTCD